MLKRITAPGPTSVKPQDVLAALLLERHIKLPAAEAAIASHLGAAVRWLETHGGVVCGPAEFSWTATAPKGRMLESPVGPLISVQWADAALPFNGKWILAPREGDLTLTLTAGCRTEEMPHLVALALGLICVHWQEREADGHAGSLGGRHNHILHLIEPHAGGKRGRTWA